MQDRFRKFVVPAAAGLLIVPAAALAGVRMLSAPPADPDPVPVVATVVDPQPTVAGMATPTAGEDPLLIACGPEAMQLIAQEQAGEMDAIAQAALDALRPVCAEAGMPLLAGPTPDPVVVVEQVPVPAAGSSTAVRAAAPVAAPVAPAVAYDDDHYEDDDDYEHEDDDEHEHEDHDEHEHEDHDEHEDGEDDD